jgi:hypothetical protein
VGIKLRKLHVFGAPVFALSNELASGSSLPKWSPRCRLGIHLGPSNEHARNVCLVLNPNTGLVSPQYHCRFDDFFESVRFQSPELSVPTTWQSLSRLTQGNTPTSWEHYGDTETNSTSASGADDTQGEAHLFIPTNNHFEEENCSQATPNSIQETTVEDEPIARRTRGSIQQEQFVANEATDDGEVGESVADQEHMCHLSTQDRMRHPVAFLAEMCGDIMYFAQAIKQPDRKHFVEAIVKEVNGHVENRNWELI